MRVAVALQVTQLLEAGPEQVAQLEWQLAHVAVASSKYVPDGHWQVVPLGVYPAGQDEQLLALIPVQVLQVGWQFRQYPVVASKYIFVADGQAQLPKATPPWMTAGALHSRQSETRGPLHL